MDYEDSQLEDTASEFELSEDARVELRGELARLVPHLLCSEDDTSMQSSEIE